LLDDVIVIEVLEEEQTRHAMTMMTIKIEDKAINGLITDGVNSPCFE
jgi:hypothetical protein